MNCFCIVSDEGLVCSQDYVMIYDSWRAAAFHKESWAQIVLHTLVGKYKHLNLRVVTKDEFSVISIMVL